MGLPRGTQIYFHANLRECYKKLWVMCKKLKNSGHSKYFCGLSGNIKIWRDSGTAVTKLLHQHDSEIEFPVFNFL